MNLAGGLGYVPQNFQKITCCPCKFQTVAICSSRKMCRSSRRTNHQKLTETYLAYTSNILRPWQEPKPSQTRRACPAPNAAPAQERLDFDSNSKHFVRSLLFQLKIERQTRKPRSCQDGTVDASQCLEVFWGEKTSSPFFQVLAKISCLEGVLEL